MKPTDEPNPLLDDPEVMRWACAATRARLDAAEDALHREEAQHKMTRFLLDRARRQSPLHQKF